ncbi:MAG: bifunctional glutamate N-acetyltransferase/amino-acid acetyltransferase ArgJ [Chloroflexota bacterium]
MKTEPDFIPSGGITSPRGFLAGAASAGIKYAGGRLDLGILGSEISCTAAAVFTTNKVKAAPVILSQQRLLKGRASALVVNSGSANACTGARGMANAEEMAALAARHIGVAPEEVLVASTGVIGLPLPMERIRDGIAGVTLSAGGGHDLARAIMTTDTVPKEVAVRGEDGCVVGGIAKGSGMIHPDMATLLCFLTTDAAVEIGFLREALREAVDVSFNMVSIDSDTSTNDMVLLMANGRSGGEPVSKGSREAANFQRALNHACIYLARAIARDGEGATKFIEVKVSGAAGPADARRVARTIVSSPLVKAAVHGSDPNWGRVLAAAGRSGAELDADRLDLQIGGVRLVKGGRPVSFNKEEVVRLLDAAEVVMTLDLNLGGGAATAWGCDLSEEYVTINSDYTT